MTSETISAVEKTLKVKRLSFVFKKKDPDLIDHNNDDEHDADRGRYIGQVLKIVA